MESRSNRRKPKNSRWSNEIIMEVEITPKLVAGRIVQITEMSAKIELKGKMGIVNLPLRSVFTDKKLEIDDQVEIYISYAKVLK
ncbi:CBO2463/CBO2479 domain-containing protein [Clostridium botulinum]|uniref:CBO2463/CBO2479 domain-containing protein n=1 Tax=Clostridium botulinum TaxID=1491 RepID=UPI001FA7D047|nr:CBO2463/CBO2479 domain-containing protein [Clostridium botulinum]